MIVLDFIQLCVTCFEDGFSLTVHVERESRLTIFVHRMNSLDEKVTNM